MASNSFIAHQNNIHCLKIGARRIANCVEDADAYNYISFDTKSRVLTSKLLNKNTFQKAKSNSPPIQPFYLSCDNSN